MSIPLFCDRTNTVAFVSRIMTLQTSGRMVWVKESGEWIPWSKKRTEQITARMAVKAL